MASRTMERSTVDPERKRFLQGAQRLVAEPRLGGTCPPEDSLLTLRGEPEWEGFVRQNALPRASSCK